MCELQDVCSSLLAISCLVHIRARGSLQLSSFRPLKVHKSYLMSGPPNSCVSSAIVTTLSTVQRHVLVVSAFTCRYRWARPLRKLLEPSKRTHDQFAHLSAGWALKILIGRTSVLVSCHGLLGLKVVALFSPLFLCMSSRMGLLIVGQNLTRVHVALAMRLFHTSLHWHTAACQTLADRLSIASLHLCFILKAQHCVLTTYACNDRRDVPFCLTSHPTIMICCEPTHANHTSPASCRICSFMNKLVSLLVPKKAKPRKQRRTVDEQPPGCSAPITDKGDTHRTSLPISTNRDKGQGLPASSQIPVGATPPLPPTSALNPTVGSSTEAAHLGTAASASAPTPTPTRAAQTQARAQPYSGVNMFASPGTAPALPCISTPAMCSPSPRAMGHAVCDTPRACSPFMLDHGWHAGGDVVMTSAASTASLVRPQPCEQIPPDRHSLPTRHHTRHDGE